MNSSDNQILPTGHKPVPNGNPENCPYLQISQGIETKNGEIPSKKNKVSSKKNDDSDLSEEETQGLQGSCPFMSTGINRRNPDLAHFELGYEYFILFLRYKAFIFNTKVLIIYRK